MAEITYLFVLAIVFVAFNEVIKNNTRNGSTPNDATSPKSPCNA